MALKRQLSPKPRRHPISLEEQTAWSQLGPTNCKAVKEICPRASTILNVNMNFYLFYRDNKHFVTVGSGVSVTMKDNNKESVGLVKLFFLWHLHL